MMRKYLLFCLIILTTCFSHAQVCSNATTGDIVVMPEPPPGGYTAGRVVNMCFTLNEFTNQQAQWFHSVIPEFGPGWDVSTLVPSGTPPASCSGGGGYWAWYESWTSCNTGMMWGPGYAYDSGAGLGCGGTANDGDPGNNFGDSQLCPRTFC